MSNTKNIEAKKIFDEWQKKREEIEKEAKTNGTWIESGLDSNNYLFAEIDNEAKRKLELLRNGEVQ